MQAQELLGLAGALRPIYELRNIPSVPTTYWHVELAERALDMLISRFGPDASAKDVWDAICAQQQAAGEGNQQQQQAAGEGNQQQQQQQAAEKAAENRDASDSACNKDTGATGDTPDPAHDGASADDDANTGGASGEAPTGGAPESGNAAQQEAEREGERGTDEVTASGMDSGADPAPGEEGDHRQDDAADASASPGVEDQSDDQTEAGDQSDDQTEAGEEAGEDAGDQTGEDASFGQEGGRTASVTPSLARVTEVARIARALSRLVADATRTEPSPLWDGERVVRELISRQVRLHRMRRNMPAVKGLLVLYDVSGSCAWIAARTWGIAEALAKRYSAFYAAQTPATEDCAEGSLDPAGIVGRGAKRFAKLPPIIGDGYGDDVAGWRRLKNAGISHLLVFGDAHGTAGYHAAAKAGIKVLWANPNACIAPRNTAWCDYTLIADEDIAGAVETLVRRT